MHVVQTEATAHLATWIVTFESSVDGDKHAGKSGGNIPLLDMNTSRLLGVSTRGEVIELLAGSLAMKGVGQRVDISERAAGTTKSEVQSLTLEIAPFTSEIQIIVSSDPQATSMDGLGGSFQIEVCEFIRTMKAAMEMTGIRTTTMTAKKV